MQAEEIILRASKLAFSSLTVVFYEGLQLRLTFISVTSRPMGEYEVDGQSCWFVAQERMEQGIEDNEFLDYGQHDSYLFGITLTSVRDVMAENKLCVLDCRPEALKLLHNSHEFLPFVIYLRPPGGSENDPDAITVEEENNGSSASSNQGSTNGLITNGNHKPLDAKGRKLYEESQAIREEFQKYFDLEVLYEDLEPALGKVKAALKKLTAETQWVPRNWVYS